MTGENPIMLQGFEWDLPGDSAHWRRLHRLVPRLRLAGFTLLWLPPACKGAGGRMDVGYGIYDPYDLGEFDQKGTVPTKYGTAREYIRLCRRLRAWGVTPVADMVMNHRLGADETEEVPVHAVQEDDRCQVDPAAFSAEVYTRFSFPGRGRRYSSFVWDSRRFTAVDYDRRSGRHGIFLLDNRRFAEDVDREKGNYDYLMGADVNVSDPAVRKEMIRWGRWYLRRTGAGGVRLDAVKHISADFMAAWLSAVGKGRHLFAVGEYWSLNLQSLLDYLDRTGGALRLFDVPLHQHFFEISHNGNAWDLRGLFEGTLTGASAEKSVTFVDNHDTQPGQSLESWVEGWFKSAAYGLILLRDAGLPCVFWGDLYGIPGGNIDPVPELPALIRARRDCAFGTEHDRPEERLFALTREGTPEVSDSGLAFLCSTGDEDRLRLYVGKHFGGRRFLCRIGGYEPVAIDEDGFGLFTVGAGSCALYTPEETLKGHLQRLFRTAKRCLLALPNPF